MLALDLTDEVVVRGGAVRTRWLVVVADPWFAAVL
jgi:hypothetical protein